MCCDDVFKRFGLTVSALIPAGLGLVTINVSLTVVLRLIFPVCFAREMLVLCDLIRVEM